MACIKIFPELFIIENETGLVKIKNSITIYPLVECIKVKLDTQQLNKILKITEICPTDSVLIWNNEGILLNKKEIANYIKPLKPYCI
jgi:altronate dehydratase